MNNTLISLNSIQFSKLDWEDWKLQYLNNIRLIAVIKKFKNIETGIFSAEKDTKMYIPRYGENKSSFWISCLSKKPQKIKLGKNLALVRLPAIKIKDCFFILDGVHRLLEIKPKFIILDYIQLSKNQCKNVLDLHNTYWTEIINKK